MMTTTNRLNVDLDLVRPCESGEYDLIPIFEGNTLALVALVCGRSQEGTATACGQTTPDEDEAEGLRYAKLFAAAPDLLAALEAFVEPWSKGGDWRTKIDYGTFDRARAAIARATA